MLRIPQRILPLLLILATASHGTQTGSATERFQNLRDRVRQARSSKDWHSNIEVARELEQFLNGSPQSLLESARADVHAGNLDEAVRKMQQFVRMGQSTDVLQTSEKFAPLRNTAAFAEIAKGMQENRAPLAL